MEIILKVIYKESNVSFGGRLGLYKYYDMDDTIEAVLKYIDAIK